jgi:hypothetical protein
MSCRADHPATGGTRSRTVPPQAPQKMITDGMPGDQPGHS